MNSAIIDFLNKTYGCDLDGKYYDNIRNWKSWWVGFNEPFHRVRVSDGRKKKSRDMYTMKMAKKVCEDWASILINDKTSVKIDDEHSERFIVGDTENGGVFGSNNFWDEANGLMERMMWSGTAAIVIRLKNASVDPNGTFRPDPDTRIDLNYIDADMIVPLTCDNGIITEAAFCSELCIHGSERIYLEVHRLEKGEYIIENYLFKADSENVICRDELPDGVPPIIRTGADKSWFAICKPAAVNPLPKNNGLGCAVFCNAIDNLKGVDLAYNNFNSDIYLGQKKVFLSKSIMADMTGEEPIAPDDVHQQLFYYVTESLDDGTGKPLVQEHNPDLRIKDNTDAVQAQLDYLSFKVGFGTKHYQFNSGSIVTATQYTGDKQELLQNAHKHFIHVEAFLYGLLKTLLWIGHNYIDSAVREDAKISVVFDQSPLIDENAERMRDLQEVRDGLMAAYEYRVKWYGETEETAKAMIKEILGSEGSYSDDELMSFGDGG